MGDCLFKQDNSLDNYVKIYGKAYLNDHIVYSSRVQEKTKQVSRFAFIDYSPAEKYISEIYCFISLRDKLNVEFDQQIIDKKLLGQGNRDSMVRDFENERIMAVMVSFTAHKTTSRGNLDDELYFFNYNQPRGQGIGRYF